MPKFTIYTDGGCSGNPGPGAWSFIIVDEEGKECCSDYGGEVNTTNNKMELVAVIKALEKASDLHPDEAIVYTDSQYVKNGITDWIKKWNANGWLTSGRKPVKNIELWKELEKLACSMNVKFSWVRGHAGDYYNELCDSKVKLQTEKLL